jgi:hypothetical protein
MTKRLDEAIAAISQLPETEQDAIATTILEKIAELRAIVVMLDATITMDISSPTF